MHDDPGHPIWKSSSCNQVKGCFWCVLQRISPHSSRKKASPNALNAHLTSNSLNFLSIAIFSAIFYAWSWKSAWIRNIVFLFIELPCLTILEVMQNCIVSKKVLEHFLLTIPKKGISINFLYIAFGIKCSPVLLSWFAYWTKFVINYFENLVTGLPRLTCSLSPFGFDLPHNPFQSLIFFVGSSINTLQLGILQTLFVWKEFFCL